MRIAPRSTVVFQMLRRMARASWWYKRKSRPSGFGTRVSRDGTELGVYISIDCRDTESAHRTLALILGLQNGSNSVPILGHNPESCIKYSKLRIIRLFCSSEELIQSVLFAETVSESHAFYNGRAIIGI